MRQQGTLLSSLILDLASVQDITYIFLATLTSNSIMAVDVISSALPISSTKAARGFPQTDKFEQLVQAMKKALGPSSGLTSDDVDVDLLSDLMRSYDSNPMEWGKYAFGDASRGYTRNLVDEGNGKSNLVSRPPSSRQYALCSRNACN